MRYPTIVKHIILFNTYLSILFNIWIIKLILTDLKTKYDVLMCNIYCNAYYKLILLLLNNDYINFKTLITTILTNQYQI